MSVRKRASVSAGEVREHAGKQVVLAVDELEHELPAVEVTATCGETVVPLTHTFTAVDGGLGSMPADHVARSVEAVKDRAMRLAVFRENVRAQLRALQTSAQGPN